ncbi:hypothetical protein P0Y43_06610 [Pseudomonas entomophila]|uniref:hypothetical protein n=1 Tax=Pseudomonas entomophila TaxID=312306 RepID=UPI0023D85961|nr:hypothetical protein [Pseudomonas entomophila]MDF0730402.1 hypothetical protein [Pseudomonas entomophila]
MTPSSLIASVEQLSRTTEQVLRQAERDLCSGTEQEVQLEYQIASTLSAIASLQLEHNPSLDQDTAQQMQAREQAQQRLRDDLAMIEQRIADTLRQQHDLRARLDNLDEQALDSLDQDPAFCQLAEQLHKAREEQHTALTAYEEIRDECAAKLPAFWANPLYRFLKIRDYGTERYTGRHLRRWTDDYLARLVGFRANHANEQILLAMQARNETQQQTRADALAQLEERHRQQVDSAREAAGMQPLQAEDQALGQKVKADKAQANTLHGQLAEFTERRDPQFKRIAERLAERLKARPLEALLREAESTPDTRDDALVKDLQRLQTTRRQLRQRIEQLHRQHDAARTEHERAKAAERALRDEAYRGSRQTYQLALPLPQVLDNYMRGELSLEMLAMLVQTARVDAPPPSPSRQTTGSWTTTTTTSWTVSNSSGGGGFSTSKSSGGGGFRTTDSF